MRRDPWRWHLHARSLELEHIDRTQVPAGSDCDHQRHLHQTALAQVQYYSSPCALKSALVSMFQELLSEPVKQRGAHGMRALARMNRESRYINTAMKRSAAQLIFPSKNGHLKSKVCGRCRCLRRVPSDV